MKTRINLLSVTKIIFYTTGCPKKHVRCLSGYCEGAINAIFLSSRYLNGRDLNLEFGTEFE